MHLTPTERDRLLLFAAAELARARRARGLRLNVPEATALIADTVARRPATAAAWPRPSPPGAPCSARTTCCPASPTCVTEVQVEAVFDDGSRLAVVERPDRRRRLGRRGAPARC